jgi:hypothetical protein
MLNEGNGLELVITIKNYNKSGGLSRLINDSLKDDEFQIQGPMGKGIGLGTEGTHIAFTAGTGCLVFIDLVAYLVR